MSYMQALDKGLDERTTELNNKFTASCANLESGVTALGTKFTAAVRDVDTTLSNKCADLYSKVDSLGLELRNKLHGAVASELDGKVESLMNKLGKKTMSSEEKLESDLEACIGSIQCKAPSPRSTPRSTTPSRAWATRSRTASAASRRRWRSPTPSRPSA